MYTLSHVSTNKDEDAVASLNTQSVELQNNSIGLRTARPESQEQLSSLDSLTPEQTQGKAQLCAFRILLPRAVRDMQTSGHFPSDAAESDVWLHVSSLQEP
jgi:hypothetical protein